MIIHDVRDTARTPARLCRAVAAILPLCLAACDDQPTSALGADKLEKVRAGVEVRDAHETPIEGLVGVKVGGGNVIYGTPDGRYIVAGDLFAVKSNGLVNLTERLRTSDRKALIASLDPTTTITFAPDDTRAVINVFTDLSCSYCRKFHQHIDEFVGHGVEVRYAAFPRAGIGSDVYHEMVSVWCADDPNEALTSAKLGESIPSRSCDVNPVDDHYRLGRAAGIGGTPGILLPNGRYIPGFDTVAKVLGELGVG